MLAKLPVQQLLDKLIPEISDIRLDFLGFEQTGALRSLPQIGKNMQDGLEFFDHELHSDVFVRSEHFLRVALLDLEGPLRNQDELVP